MYPYRPITQGPESMPMPVNATNQQGSSVQGASNSMFGGLGGFGFGGYGMPQMGYGGMGGYGGFGGFGMPQMGYGGGFGGMGGYGGFGGGFGMPQMGYGGYGGFGGFGMPQMGYGLGSFGPQMGFGGYGNYGGFQPPQFATTDVKSPYLQDQMWAYQQNQQRNANQQPPPGMKLNPSYDAGYAMADDMPLPGSAQALRKQQFIPDDNPPPGMELNPGYRGDDVIGMHAGPASMKYRLTQGANPSTGVMPSEPIPAPGSPYIADETGQYDPNRGNYGQILAPTYSEPSTPGTEPLSVANPERNQEIIGTPIPANSAPINQPRRMTNSMNMGLGSFFGGIGPSNFGNFY